MAKKNIIVTTCDLKREYEVIGPVYFQISNKGLFSNALSKLVDKYHKEIIAMRQQKVMSEQNIDWGFLYGEWSVGQNEFEKAFFVATEELKERARILGADAIIGMRQDIDLDTSGFQYFYLQMYGTAVKYLDGEAEYLPEAEVIEPEKAPNDTGETSAVQEQTIESAINDDDFLVEAVYLNTATKIANKFEEIYGNSSDKDIQKLRKTLNELKSMEGMNGNNKDIAMRWIKGFFDHGKSFYVPERLGFKICCPLCGKSQSKHNSICDGCGALFEE